MNPEPIPQRALACMRSVCSAPIVVAMLLVLSTAAHSAESAATNNAVAARATAPAGWKLIAEGGTDAEFLNDPAAAAPDDTNAHPMRLTIRQRNGAVGIKEASAGHTDVAAGQWYDLVFRAMTQNGKHFAFTVSLEGDDGKVCARTTLPEVGGTEWKTYTVSLNTRLPATKSRVVITLAEPGTVWFDDLTLVLRKRANPGKPVEGKEMNP